MCKHSTRAWLPWLAFLVAITPVALAGCRFDPSGLRDLVRIYDEKVAFSEPTEAERTVVLSDPGSIIVYHGKACAQSARDGEENPIRVRHEVTMPAFVTRATVFLNGWELAYLSSDHHVSALAAIITNVKYNNNKLTWEAGGILSEEDFDDAYRWCYRYAAVGWAESRIDANVLHDDSSIFTAQPKDMAVAVKSVSGSLPSSSTFSPGQASTALPRGFGFRWADFDEHHVLELGYHQVHHPSVDAAVRWQSDFLFGDDSAFRNYHAGEIVSALGGDGVGVIDPPYAIGPSQRRGSGTGCIVGDGHVVTEEHVVEQVPFEYAIPVLSGWELTYACDDQHVTQVGVWLDGWSYQRPAGANLGTLRYRISSVLRDKHGLPNHFGSHKIKILGLEPIPQAHKPTAVILDPAPGRTFSPGTSVSLRGRAMDAEDGELPAKSVRWYSNRDGFLGTGSHLRTPLSGPSEPCNPEYVEHVITLRVTDSDGNQSSRRVTVRVGRLC